MKLSKFTILLITLIVIFLSLILVKISKSSKSVDSVAQSTQTTTNEVHYHAGFQVYVNDVLQDFTDFKYMHIEPCSLDDHAEIPNPEKEQIEKAHLHDGIGDVVHVHRTGSVWQDLFTNLNYHINIPFEAYINGKLVQDFLNMPINSYDSAVIFIENHINIQERLASAVTKDHILEVESKSENCGS